MKPLDRLKHQPTKTLHAIVRRVRLQKRRKAYVPLTDAIVASVAVTIINKRRRK
jgi:hypothetical protein